MRLLDLFCGAGGAGMGYRRAGFEVVGVDNRPMPRYPFEFHQADALEFVQAHGKGFDVIHASPPCQAFSDLRHISKAQRTATGEYYPDLLEPTRIALRVTGNPYVIENVPGAPLLNPIQLCGSAFGNDMLRRHRLFESNLFLFSLPCNHRLHTPRFPALRSDRKGKYASVVGVFGYGGGSAKHKDLWEEAMGIDWMNKRELSQAIPPAYTQYIGEQLMLHLEDAA